MHLNELASHRENFSSPTFSISLSLSPLSSLSPSLTFSMCLYQRVVSKIKTTFALERRANTVKHDRRSCASHGQHYSQRSNFVSGSGRYNWEQAGARAIVLWPYFIEFSFSIILMAYGFFPPPELRRLRETIRETLGRIRELIPYCVDRWIDWSRGNRWKRWKRLTGLVSVIDLWIKWNFIFVRKAKQEYSLARLIWI